MQRVILIFLFIGFASVAQARTFVGGGFFASQQGKENVRWTLADWLQQKKNFSLQDQWLALNRQANFFEIGIEGGQSKYDLEVSGNTEEHTVDRFSATIWVSIFGLQYTKDTSDDDYESTSTQLNVRVFGQSSQSTYLTLHYGVRNWEDLNTGNEIENQYGGAQLNLYIFKYFGLEGMYRHNLSARDSSGREYEGNRAEYGAFIDVYFVRLYGNAFKETTDVTTSGTTTTQTREGIDAGVKFYF